MISGLPPRRRERTAEEIVERRHLYARPEAASAGPIAEQLLKDLAYPALTSERVQAALADITVRGVRKDAVAVPEGNGLGILVVATGYAAAAAGRASADSPVEGSTSRGLNASLNGATE